MFADIGECPPHGRCWRVSESERPHPLGDRGATHCDPLSTRRGYTKRTHRHPGDPTRCGLRHRPHELRRRPRAAGPAPSPWSRARPRPSGRAAPGWRSPRETASSAVARTQWSVAMPHDVDAPRPRARAARRRGRRARRRRPSALEAGVRRRVLALEEDGVDALRVEVAGARRAVGADHAVRRPGVDEVRVVGEVGAGVDVVVVGGRRRRRTSSRWRRARSSVMAAATSAPPATAREPPSQKSFWTSTTIRAPARSWSPA